VALALAGGGLFFLPGLGRPLWAWEISPFNARLLGAIYLSSFAAVLQMYQSGRWTPARLVLPMIFSFTSIVLLQTVMEIDRFLFDRPATWAWMVLYGILPLTSAYYYWRYRSFMPASCVPLSPAWRRFLLIEGVVLALYTVALLIAPVAATAFWPWAVDTFHARSYCGMFSAPSVAALMVSRRASPAELWTLGLGQVVWGGGAAIGVPLLGMGLERIDWAAVGTWVWIAMKATLMIVGLITLVHAHRLQRESRLDA
jgi:hypothetical protein